MQQPPRMRLFQGSPSTSGGLHLRSASARPPSLLNSVYLLQFNLFAHTSWPGGAALHCRSKRATAGRSPVLPEPGTAPQSRGCADSSHRPTQAYLRTGNFTARPGRGSQAVCFVLYLLLQLGEPQRNTCYFFICNKNGNKLYFCSRIWAVCLSCCLLPVCGERWVAGA